MNSNHDASLARLKEIVKILEETAQIWDKPPRIAECNAGDKSASRLNTPSPVA